MLKKFVISAILACSMIGAQAKDVIEIIYTSGPGTAGDQVSRAVAASDSLREQLGTNPVVLNKLGGSGAVPSKEGANAKPDGRTWTVTNATTTGVLAFQIKDLGYDPMKSFEHINIMAASPRGLIVHRDFPANNFQELVRVLKENPNKYNFGGIPLSTNHLDMQTLAKSLDFKYEWIGYQSNNHVLPDLLSGRVHGGIFQIALLLPYIKTGQLKVIAVTWHERLADFPNIPTWIELGYPMLNVPSWYGIAVPKGTPPETVQKISRALTSALNEPGVRSRLASSYNFVLNYGPERATKFVQNGLTAAQKQAEFLGIVKQ